MEATLRRLLGRQDSRLALVTRVTLRSFAAWLRLQLRLYPEDTAAPDSREVLRLIRELLAGTNQNSPTLPASVVYPASSATFDLEPVTSEPSLRAEFEQDSNLKHAVEQCAPGTVDGEALWQSLQLWFLRRPEEEAQQLRRAALGAARRLGAIEEASPIYCNLLSGVAPELIFPALRGKISARGLAWSDAQPIDARISACLTHPQGENLRQLAFICSAALQLIQTDAHLHHALASINRFGVLPLSGNQRAEFERTLVKRFCLVCQATTPAERITKQIEMDEAIHSLVYDPPAAPGSWWDRFRKGARRLLFEAVDQAAQNGVRITVQELSGPYARVHARSHENLERDHGGIPGEVQACLRVYAEVDGRILPGRVLYSALRR